MKLCGAGNDFVVIDNRRDVLPIPSTEFARRVCHRRLSVGADGLLLLSESIFADFRMEYFNADGSQAETCGNGARCIAKFAHLNGISGTEIRFETVAGLYQAEILGSQQVKVQLGNPQQVRINFPLKLDNECLSISFVNTGVPHVVNLVTELAAIDLAHMGAKIRYHKSFGPRGTNVNWVKIQGRHDIGIRTYERGIEGETLACGTGSVAGAIIAVLTGNVETPVAVKTASGIVLTVHFAHKIVGEKIEITNTSLEGDARLVCRGQLTSSAWDY